MAVVVRLCVLDVDADKLEVDLVFYIAHHDECGYDAFALTCCHRRRYLAVPDVVCCCEQRADGVGRHGQEDGLILVCYRLPAGHPLRLARVAEVSGIGRDVVEGVEIVVLALADGIRDAGLEGVGEEGVTAAEAVGAYTALSVCCSPGLASKKP